MLTYHEYERKTYEWFINKHNQDPEFTFALRRNGTQGAKADYFIGTEKSQYFGTTFWTIPVRFPGSSTDLFDVFFGYGKEGYKYSFEFNQTKTPQDQQNINALELLQIIKKKVMETEGLEIYSENGADMKMFGFKIGSIQTEYSELENLYNDLDKQSKILIPLVDEAIVELKKSNPDFIAHRITKGEFDSLNSKMENRREKYKDEKASKENSFQEFLKEFAPEDVKTYFKFLREIQTHFRLQHNDERLTYSIREDRLNFTIGNRYAWNLYVSKQKGKFGVMSAEKLTADAEPFTGGTSLPFYNFYDVFDPNDEEKKSIFDAMEDELKRTNKSNFRRHNNEDFENYAFGQTKNNRIMNEPINAILYGPPGTGKTYRLKSEYFDRYTSKETSISKEVNFDEVVRDLTWWHVIGIALIETKTSKVSDLVENRWVKHKASISESKNVRATIWGTLQMHTIQESETVAYTQRQAPLIFDKNKDKSWSILENEAKEQAPELYEILDSVNNFNPNPDKEIKRYVFTTFHQSYSYEDFIEGIKPVMGEDDNVGSIGYSIENGVFKDLCVRAASDPDNQYAIFIDEINRGNVSAIFGELITLIEIDKRKSGKNPISALLPYSKKAFSVPSNVDIIGTMNTADRSVEALDTALRRRFVFEEMMPNPAILEDKEVEGIVLAELLETINKRIEALIDRDHTIGHAYFMDIEDENGLKRTFKNKIIPLLQEYFYGDYRKMEMVIGPDFFDQDIKKEKVEFAVRNSDFDVEHGKYQLKDVGAIDFNIVSALNRLQNKQVD